MWAAGGTHAVGDGTTSVVSVGCWWYACSGGWDHQCGECGLLVEDGTTSVVSVGCWWKL